MADHAGHLPLSRRLSNFWSALCRRKHYEEVESGLARVLTLFDLINLGIGSSMGLGAYVLVGDVAYRLAGPAVTVSFLIAAVASAFAGVCYAEFAARVPKAGSAYVYSYVTIGEFVAFTIGWNLILEYVIGTSSVARGMSSYLDALTHNWLSDTMVGIMPMHVPFLATYPDFLSFFVVLLVAILLGVGVKESSWLNNVCTVVNMVTICIIIVAGAIKANPANWFIAEADIPANLTKSAGVGGFMPFGLSGVMSGAAQCFYGFVGFDCVATCGEEALSPERNVPLSIVISLVLIFLSYFGVSVVLTMMAPYYLLSSAAPIVDIYEQFGWEALKWIVTVGAMFALCTCLLGSLFPLPRVLYAMSTDGIMYKRLGKINPRTQTPLIATILSGILSGLMALLFDLNQLIDMMSIGTLMAYTIVAVCVLILRYQVDEDNLSSSAAVSYREIGWQIINPCQTRTISNLTYKVAAFSTAICCICVLVVCIVLAYMQAYGVSVVWYSVLAGFGTIMFLSIIVIARQPTIEVTTSFSVPLVPWVPCLSVLINTYLMFQLDFHTWVRFLAWAVVGFFIYFTYGIRHSVEGSRINSNRETENILRRPKTYGISGENRCSVIFNGENDPDLPAESMSKFK